MSVRALAALIFFAFPQVVFAQTQFPNIRGAWVTPLAQQSVSGATAYVRERLVFAEVTNTISIEVFVDDEGKIPLFTYSSIGPYRLGDASPTTPGAWLLDAENERSTVTIYRQAPEIWQALNLGGCPLKIGVAVAIADCVAGPPFNAARCVELDLVAVEDGQLRLGARDTDRCKERPTTLGKTVYRGS